MLTYTQAGATTIFSNSTPGPVWMDKVGQFMSL